MIQCCFQVSGPIKFYPAQMLSRVVQCCHVFSNVFNCFQTMSGVVKRCQVLLVHHQVLPSVNQQEPARKNDGSQEPQANHNDIRAK